MPILRSGLLPHTERSTLRDRLLSGPVEMTNAAGQPIVEVDGKDPWFGLPGKPIFDALDPKGFLSQRCCGACGPISHRSQTSP